MRVILEDNYGARAHNNFFVDVEEGALLPSPTREKLMPVLPRSKTGSPQRGSPQKTISSRHGSPMKGSPQKSPKKISKGIADDGRNSGSDCDKLIASMSRKAQSQLLIKLLM